MTSSTSIRLAAQHGNSTTGDRRHKPLTGESVQSKPDRPLRVLIVEDELLVAENTKEVLKASGFQVAGICRTGEEVIARFEKFNPDLVLMDIRLAGTLDGIQTAVVIHYTLRETPVLFMTAFTPGHFPHLSAVRRGLYDYITKPCEPPELIAHLRDLWKRTQNQ